VMDFYGKLYETWRHVGGGGGGGSDLLESF
jgi:hypothetical protein